MFSAYYLEFFNVLTAVHSLSLSGHCHDTNRNMD